MDIVEQLRYAFDRIFREDSQDKISVATNNTISGDRVSVITLSATLNRNCDIYEIESEIDECINAISIVLMLPSDKVRASSYVVTISKTETPILLKQQQNQYVSKFASTLTVKFVVSA